MIDAAKWNRARLRKHEHECLLLGNGAVAVIYELCGANRVRVRFFLHEHGRFEEQVQDTGKASTLIRLLNMHENTKALVRPQQRTDAPDASAIRVHPFPQNAPGAAQRPPGIHRS